jgi:uncharacterized protein (UPF0276 family)
VNAPLPNLGLGIGWRPELAMAIDRRADLGFVEFLVEDFADGIPPAVDRLRARGRTLIPHGVSLSLGGTAPPDPRQLDRIARLAEAVRAPLVSEHLAFVRAGGLETGHLLPLPRTREGLDVVVRNVRQAQAALPVPLALENIATLLEWPDATMDEADFLAEVLDRTDALLLLDVENVYANARNHGGDPVTFLDRIDLRRVAYLHVAGGAEQGGWYHDTHTCPVPQPVLDLVEEVYARAAVPGVMLERDDRFPGEAEFNAELDAIAAAVRRGTARREKCHVAS